MTTNLSEAVRELLRCPETGKTLREATPAELENLDAEFPEGGLVTEDGSRAYPIRDGFPILIASEAVVATK